MSVKLTEFTAKVRESRQLSVNRGEDSFPIKSTVPTHAQSGLGGRARGDLRVAQCYERRSDTTEYLHRTTTNILGTCCAA
eukprot:2175887-Prymnesium_polylepis.1